MDNIGIYIGLTGKKLNGFDMIHLNLADYYIQHEYLNELINDLRKFLFIIIKITGNEYRKNDDKRIDS